VQSVQSMQSRPFRPLRNSGVAVPLLADERSTVREENLGLMLNMTRFLGRCRCVGILLSIEQDRRTFGPKDRSKTGGIGFSRSKEKHQHWCNVGFLCIHLSPERNWIAQSRLQTVRQWDVQALELRPQPFGGVCASEASSRDHSLYSSRWIDTYIEILYQLIM
jgi:hypothetical protein